MNARPTLEPGWQPYDEGTERYWTGKSWRGEARPVEPAAAPAPTAPKPKDEGLVIVGVIGMLLFPILGIVAGLILLARGNRPVAGVVITVLSVVVMVVAYQYLLAA